MTNLVGAKAQKTKAEKIAWALFLKGIIQVEEQEAVIEIIENLTAVIRPPQ